MSNTYPYEVNFEFKNQNYFQVEPTEGSLRGNSKLDVKISHSFLRVSEGGGKIEENLKLKIKNGKKI